MEGMLSYATRKRKGASGSFLLEVEARMQLERAAAEG